MTLLAKDRSIPAITAQVLFYPITDAAFDTPSYRQFATGYKLRRDEMRWFWDQYVPERARRWEVTASPLRASIEQLVGLPPALHHRRSRRVARRGRGLRGEAAARSVAVTAVRYAAIVHDFVVLDALRNTQAAIAATAQASGYLRRALGLAAR